MAALPTKLSILFCPLLSTITQCLQLPQPEYSVLDQASHKVSITIRTSDGSVDGVYVGGPAPTIEGSFENAAQLAICDLKKIYDIYVKDVTALRNQNSERCTNLWRLKSQELGRMVKGLQKIESQEEFASPEISHLHVVAIDFVQVMNMVVNKCPVYCSDIEVIEHTPSAFTAWVSINHHNNANGCTSFYGETTASYVTAEQELAAKVITYLVPIYNIEIIDANYEPTEYDITTYIRETIKEKCKLLKEAIPLHQKNSQAKVSMDTVALPLTPAKISVRSQRQNKLPSTQAAVSDQHPTSGRTEKSKGKLFR